MKSIRMAKSEGVTSYLTQITQVRDELSAVGEAVGEAELVRTTLNGVSKPWAMFVQAIVGRDNLSSWERLWDVSLRRRPEEAIYRATHLVLRRRRRMWLFQLNGGRGSLRLKDPQVQASNRENQRERRRKTLAK